MEQEERKKILSDTKHTRLLRMRVVKILQENNWEINEIAKVLQIDQKGVHVLRREYHSIQNL